MPVPSALLSVPFTCSVACAGMIGQFLKSAGATKKAEAPQLPEPSPTNDPSVFLFDRIQSVAQVWDTPGKRKGLVPVFAMVKASATPGPDGVAKQDVNASSGTSVLVGSARPASTRMLSLAAWPPPC